MQKDVIAVFADKSVINATENRTNYSIKSQQTVKVGQFLYFVCNTIWEKRF